MSIAVEFELLPLYGQVSVHDAAVGELPDWVTGEEAVVASDAAVLVATRSDTEGDVTMRVLEAGDDGASGIGVFDGYVELPQGILELGSITGADLRQLQVAQPGPCHVRVYVDNPGMASEVSVVLDRGSIVQAGPESA